MYGEPSKRESCKKAFYAIALSALIFSAPLVLACLAGNNCVEYNKSRGAEDIWNWSLILVAIVFLPSLFFAYVIVAANKREIKILWSELRKKHRNDEIVHRSIRVQPQQSPTDEQISRYLDWQSEIYATIDEMVLYFCQTMASVGRPGLNTTTANSLDFGPNPGWWATKNTEDCYAYIAEDGTWGYGGTYRITIAAGIVKWRRWSFNPEAARPLITTEANAASGEKREMIFDCATGQSYESLSNNATPAHAYGAIRKMIITLLKRHAPDAIDDLPRL